MVRKSSNINALRLTVLDLATCWQRINLAMQSAASGGAVTSARGGLTAWLLHRAPWVRARH